MSLTTLPTDLLADLVARLLPAEIVTLTAVCKRFNALYERFVEQFVSRRLNQFAKLVSLPLPEFAERYEMYTPILSFESNEQAQVEMVKDIFVAYAAIDTNYKEDNICLSDIVDHLMMVDTEYKLRRIAITNDKAFGKHYVIYKPILHNVNIRMIVQMIIILMLSKKRFAKCFPYRSINISSYIDMSISHYFMFYNDFYINIGLDIYTHQFISYHITDGKNIIDCEEVISVIEKAIVTNIERYQLSSNLNWSPKCI